MTVSEDPGAREAITTFETLERFEADRHDDGFSLLECHLYTGRTHQIRVHMRYIHHDVVGDALYGHGGVKKNCGLKRQFLHSWYVSFEHPVTGENVLVRNTLPRSGAHGCIRISLGTLYGSYRKRKGGPFFAWQMIERLTISLLDERLALTPIVIFNVLVWLFFTLAFFYQDRTDFAAVAPFATVCLLLPTGFPWREPHCTCFKNGRSSCVEML